MTTEQADRQGSDPAPSDAAVVAPSASPTDSDAGVLRVLVLHAALVALPVLAVLALVGLWLVALPVGLLVGAGVTAWRLRGVEDRVAAAVGARPVTADEEPRLALMAENLALAVGVPTPRLFVIDADSSNALSWGVVGATSSLAVTEGLLRSASVIELEGIVGHLVAGANRRSTEVASLAAVLFGAVARGPLVGLVASLVDPEEDRPIVLADIDGVAATRYPPGLIAALERIEGEDTSLPALPPALTSLCVAAPHGVDGPFAVHPRVADRIAVLREL